jgi:nucleotide-binding universal stress UspA family protein
MWRAKKILVGTDFSKTANVAVRVALQLGRRMAAHVDVAHVLLDGPQPPADERRLDELADEDGVDAQAHTLSGNPALCLLGQREVLGADLLVLGARGLRSLRRFFLGSVADRALRHPGCPLLLVNDTHRGEFKKILVGVEYPDARTPWLEVALALAHHLRAEVVVLHVLPEKGFVSDAHHVELSPRTVMERLRKLLASVDATIPMQVTVRRGDPAQLIPREARKMNVDLVVLGAERAASGWPGRVADRVARTGLPALLYVWPEEESTEDDCGD